MGAVNLATTRFSEVGYRAELRGEEDGGEESAVERLNAFARAFFVGVSGECEAQWWREVGGGAGDLM